MAMVTTPFSVGEVKHRKRVHTVSCGMAKLKKCKCVCEGARHQELVKKGVSAQVDSLLEDNPIVPPTNV
jgi:hypothetical protein